MGAENSKFTEDSGHSPILSEPWREINWGEEESALQYVKDYEPRIKGQQLRILLYGPVGAGKSSFINSVQSVLKGRMCVQALVDNTSHGSSTKKYRTYKIKTENQKTVYPFVFNDTMGLDAYKGVYVDDIKLALRGRVKEGYEFRSFLKLRADDPKFNTSPTANDKVHVLVCVIPADTICQIKERVVQKIRDIREEASRLRIPQVAILTKIDEAWPEINEDLKNVYKLEYLKTKMEQLSAAVGIPMNCIFPVKNYKSEINLDNDTDSLILSSLRRIIDYGEDAIKNPKKQPKKKQVKRNV